MRFKKIFLIVCITASVIFVAGMFFPMNIEKDTETTIVTFKEFFLHNMTAQFVSIAFGVLSLGLYSLFYMLLNFLLLGMIVTTLNQTDSIMNVLNTIIFHGVFEIPAILLTITLGIFIPWKLIIMLKNKRFEKKFLKTIGTVCVSLVILTVIAAFIESYISQHII